MVGGRDRHTPDAQIIYRSIDTDPFGLLFVLAAVPDYRRINLLGDDPTTVTRYYKCSLITRHIGLYLKAIEGNNEIMASNDFSNSVRS
jgi:hypothetical protein